MVGVFLSFDIILFYARVSFFRTDAREMTQCVPEELPTDPLSPLPLSHRDIVNVTDLVVQSLQHRQAGKLSLDSCRSYQFYLPEGSPGVPEIQSLEALPQYRIE